VGQALVCQLLLKQLIPLRLSHARDGGVFLKSLLLHLFPPLHHLLSTVLRRERPLEIIRVFVTCLGPGKIGERIAPVLGKLFFGLVGLRNHPFPLANHGVLQNSGIVHGAPA